MTEPEPVPNPEGPDLAASAAPDRPAVPENPTAPESLAAPESPVAQSPAAAGPAAERPTAPPPTGPVRETFRDEFRDAIAPRTVGLVVAVLLLQLGFILSYVGAFHDPAPHRVPVEVVAPAQVSGSVLAQLNALPGTPLAARPAASESSARADVVRGSVPAAFVVNPGGTTDRLYVASGGGAALATAVETVAQRVDASRHRTVAVTDLVPLQPGDARGLTGFYLVIGWIVGGYLLSALLGTAKGARPATFRRAVWRLGATVPYAVVSGLGGALVVGPGLHAITGHFGALWLTGTLLVLASAATTMAFQVLFGIAGIGLTVLFFVVLGNPSAGGPYQPPLLPPFWRALSGALPNGAGTTVVRQIVYFNGHDIATPVIVIAAYVVGGTLLTLVASLLRHRRNTAAQAAAAA